jgi:hypothetical protein
MKILITQELDSTLAGVYNIEAGKEYNTSVAGCPITQEDAEILLVMGVASTDTMKRQLRNVGHKDKPYKRGDVVFKDNLVYRANKHTANTFIRAEWDLIGGIEDYVSGIAYLANSVVFKNDKIYKSLTGTSTTFKIAEWVEK